MTTSDKQRAKCGENKAPVRAGSQVRQMTRRPGVLVKFSKHDDVAIAEPVAVARRAGANSASTVDPDSKVKQGYGL